METIICADAANFINEIEVLGVLIYLNSHVSMCS